MTDLIAKLRRCGIDDAADPIESLVAQVTALERRWADAESSKAKAESDLAVLQARLAEADALLRPCPHCGMALALCYDAKRTGAIACCPDCRHDAHLAREEKP